MKRFKKTLKRIAIFGLLLFLILYFLFYHFTMPKSDSELLEAYKENNVELDLTYDTYQSYRFRKIARIQDTTLPTLVFVHGTIGSSMDFKSYFADSILQRKANMLAYDRIGYNYKDLHPVQESIAFERDMLMHITRDIPSEKLILVGYSYGGPIALATTRKVKALVLLAPAVSSEVEPMPSMLKLYQWGATRWLVPPIWREASKEKLSHPADLRNFENNWTQNKNPIVLVHGDNDWIVPYENSQYLVEKFPSEQLELVTLPNANHDLVWSRFDTIKEVLLKHLD